MWPGAECDRLMDTITPKVQKTKNPDALRWNKRYLMGSTEWLSHPPKKLLIDFAHLLPNNGRALDVASGVGTNSILLAEQGLSTIALDVSYIATKLAKDRFSKIGLGIEAAVCDLTGLWLPANSFDVIMNFCYLERSIFPVLRQSLKPGGLFFFESYLNSPSHTFNQDYYLESGELCESFSELEIIHSKQIDRESGTQGSGRKLEQLVARKPRLPKRD